MDSYDPMMQQSQDLLPLAMDDGLPQSVEDSFTWAAGRFVAHKKSINWYASFALIAIVVTAAIYFMTRDVITVSIFIITAILFVVSAVHKPKHLRYTLDGKGIHIGKKVYPYEIFRAFSITDEGRSGASSISCILFRPLQTFVPQIAVYYDQKDEARIANILLGRLPLEEYRPDWINWLLDRVRF